MIEKISSLHYQIVNIIDVYNPELKKDVDYLIRLEKALYEWMGDLEATHKLLGLFPEDE